MQFKQPDTAETDTISIGSIAEQINWKHHGTKVFLGVFLYMSCGIAYPLCLESVAGFSLLIRGPIVHALIPISYEVAYRPNAANFCVLVRTLKGL